MTTKNQERTCNYCHGSMKGKRRNAKYCSSTCRSNHWLKNNEDKNSINQTYERKGIIRSSSQATTIPDTTDNSNSTTSGTVSLTINDKVELDKLYKELEILENKRIALNINEAELGIRAITNIGATIGRNKSKNSLGEFAGSTLALAGSVYLMSLLPKEDQEQKQKEKEKEISSLEDQKMIIKFKITVIENKNKTNTTHNHLSNQYDNPSLNKRLNQKVETVNSKEKKHIQLNKSKDNVSSPLKIGNDKIITSKELIEYDYESIDTHGLWLEFIGKPSIDFYSVIHGKAGEGKSTFAIQFALYLASKFDRVLYVSGEEGFSMTMSDKFKRLGASNDNLIVANLKSYDEIKNELKSNKYYFIFIDSIDTLHIGPVEMNDLRNDNKDTAFITISQSTKDGKMRGSNEIVHDCDVVIQVEDGKATTTKNRFLEKGKVFDIF